MIRFLLFNLLFAVTIICPFIFPPQGAASYASEQSPITLDLVNTPTRQILKEIEKQTDYTIEILNFLEAADLDKVLNNKKSLVLNQAPLDQALSRLLKDFNYSVISNDKQKTMTLVLLNKEGSKANAASPGYTAGEARSSSMDEVTAAFEDFSNRQGKPPVADQEEQVKTSMDGVTAAFEEFSRLDETTPEAADLEEQEETSMDGAVAAFEEFEVNRGGQSIGDEELQQEETSMDGVTAAFEEFNMNDGRQPSGGEELQQEETSMDGVTAAFEEFNKLKVRN